MPWVALPIWHGTSDEAMRLIDAISHHCECQSLKQRCPAHDLMLNQHTLDHLLWLRWLHLKEGKCNSQLSARTRSRSAR